MGRPRTRNKHLPPRLYKLGLAYWYAGTKPWRNLGRDVGKAFEAYNRLEHERGLPRNVTTFAVLSSRYVAEGMADLEPRTKKDYLGYIVRLNKAFGHMPLEDIEPGSVWEYHDARGKVAKVQANREKACLSLIWNWGRAKRLTRLPNPCAGIHRHEEQGRSVLVDDALYFAVWKTADWDVRDVLDLAFLTGQRPADVFKMSWDDVHGDELWVKQGKTDVPLRFEIEGQLAVLLNDLKMRHPDRLVTISASTFDNRFEHDRRAAKVNLNDFQLRDMRAKAATETAENKGLRAAQHQLGHKKQNTTEIYTRKKGGRKVKGTR